MSVKTTLKAHDLIYNFKRVDILNLPKEMFAVEFDDTTVNMTYAQIDVSWF